MTRKSPPHGGPSPIVLAKGDREQTTAQARAEALAVDLSAVAAGYWLPTPIMLEALAELTWATAWDLAVAS